MAKKKKTSDSNSDETLDVVDTGLEFTAEPMSEVEALAESAPAAVQLVSPVAEEVKRWRVLETKSVAFNGRRTQVKAGMIVSVKTHGMAGMAAMQSEGVKLQEV